MTALRERLAAGAYQGYTYAYPHKSAYRTLAAPVDLGRLWAQEERHALFAYVHIPFCSYRCGFCNLFALGNPPQALVGRYVEQLIRQMSVVGTLLGEHRIARFAIGGGTPGYLSAQQLERVLAAAREHLGADPHAIPAGIEMSPETATRDRLRVCREAGISRLSMGVQSFNDAELRQLLRPAQPQAVAAGIATIRELGFPVLNLDLIYGIEGQSVASFEESLMTALSHDPEELYLYPLYVRPGTGLGRAGEGGEVERCADLRMRMYCVARERLLAAGYRQVSMRMFRASRMKETDGPVYCCQEDGMVGLGCGARSYTRALHYCDPYAVARAGVMQLLQRYVDAPASSFMEARHGFVLDGDEQRRRYVIQSLLSLPGLEESAYEQRFASPVFEDLPQLAELISEGLALREGGRLVLTLEGLAASDVIGPWLGSPQVSARMGHAAD